MALASAFLTVVLPVLLVAGVGTVLGRRFDLDLQTLTKMSLNGLTPALVLQTLLTTEVHPVTGIRLVVAYFVVAGVALLLGYAVTPGMPGGSRRAVMAAASVGNNGNMGLPIALFALGQAGLDQSILIFLSSVVLAFLLLPALYGSAGGARAAVRAVVRLPAIWAMALAVVLRLAQVPIPTGIMRGITLLASATLPMILLTLGIQLGVTGRVVITRAVGIAVTIRILVLPIAALGVGLLLGLHGLPLQALVLASAMPTAVNAYLLAREYDGDHGTVAHAVTVSTLGSIVTAAIATALLPTIGGL